MSRTIMMNDILTDQIKLIVFIPGKNRLMEYKLEVNNLIGRKSEKSKVDIQIDSPLVSQQHARIYYYNGYYYYEDMMSTNGTFINGELFGKKSENGLKGKVIKLGDVFRVDHRDLKNPHKDAVIMFAVGTGEYDLTCKSIELNPTKSIVIGRNAGNLRINNQAVSERHAAFYWEDGKWNVEDFDSTNGIYINGKRVQGRCELNELDVVRIANYIFVYTSSKIRYFCETNRPGALVGAASQNGRSANNKGGELSIFIEERVAGGLIKKRVLLQDINLTLKKGEMVMILGGSGAGKTTLVNAILGYEKAKGTILLDGYDLYKNYSQMKGNMGFVPQQDLLRMEDTVYATMASSAEMKMDPNSTAEQREARINYVLESLGLSKERNNIVKKLAGGQRKRLSIAVELVSDPDVFVLDEPDSGVDGPMAEKLMEQLRKIANQGKIVIVITHSPDRTRKLFDKVIVLAKSQKENVGRLAYFGSIPRALEFFNAPSLEGVVKKVNSKSEGGEGLADYYISEYMKSVKVSKK